MELSIVIVGWNVADLLVACVESIEKNPPTAAYDVWVVDNASKDDTVQRVRERFPDVHVIQNHTNVGFATANNQAIQQCQGKYVLLLNPDTVVLPGALQTLVDSLRDLPQAGAVGSLLQSPDGSMQQSCMPFPTVSREAWRLFHFDVVLPYGIYAMKKWSLTEPHPVDSLQGASLMVKREALDKSGLLDPEYFMYTEEVDLCFRIKKSGWNLYWIPKSRIVHYGGQSTRQMAAEMFLQLYRSKVTFFRKNYGKLSSEMYKLVLTLAALFRIALGSLITVISPSRKKFHQELIENYRRLLVALPKI